MFSRAASDQHAGMILSQEAISTSPSKGVGHGHDL